MPTGISPAMPGPPTERSWRRPAPHTGRRPGESGTRVAILQAARALFAERGFEGATIRAIAARAAVDPALVHHYFGSKEQLFTCAVELPVSPPRVLPALLADDVESVGERLVHLFITTWDDPDNRSVLTAILRTALVSPQSAGLVRQRLMDEVFTPLVAALGAPNAPLRVAFTASQLLGIAVARYVGRLEPVASMPATALAASLGPTIQRYLLGELPPATTDAADAAGAADAAVTDDPYPTRVR
jgi:AcrR family transcriptional regulator